MTKTNFEKLVRWDADFYKEQSADECIVCLTEQEVYLVGQIIDSLRWFGTRWIGDLTGLDFDLIASNLEGKLADRLTCQNVTQLLERIEQLSDKIDVIFEQTLDETSVPPLTDETTFEDLFTPTEVAENLSVEVDICDDDGKSAIYSGVRELVNFIHANNADALEKISQVGNLADQASRLISGVPLVGLLPFDEAVEFVGFLIQELEDEYQATVDEELLQTTICDLFCIAVQNDCKLDYNDILDYFSGKIDTSAMGYAMGFADLVQFLLTGTFSGDDFFYIMCLIQFIAVALGEHFFNIGSREAYLIRMEAGLNSPDADWMLLCDECPAFVWVIDKDFTKSGMGNGWSIQVDGIGVAGVMDGTNGLKGVDRAAQDSITAKALYTFGEAVDLLNVRSIMRMDTVTGGSSCFTRHRRYETTNNAAPFSDLGGSGSYSGSLTNVIRNRCNDVDNGTNITRWIEIHNNGEYTVAGDVYIEKVQIVGRDIGNPKPVGSKWIKLSDMEDCAGWA